MSGFRNSTVVSEGGQGNLTHGPDPDIHSHPEGIDDNKDWDLHGAIGGESAQHVVVKRE